MVLKLNYLQLQKRLKKIKIEIEFEMMYVVKKFFFKF